MAYNPTPVPMEGITQDYLFQELLRISGEFGSLEEGRYMVPLAVAPRRPREGMLVRADGTNWNPGSGAGYYEYRGGIWRPLSTGSPGEVALFAQAAAPEGWLLCNGVAVSRSVYAGLFAAIGTQYGVGDGSTTFNLPEVRGEFLRAADVGRGVDAGRTVGSAQGQDWKGFYMTNTGQGWSSGYSHGPVYMGKDLSNFVGALFTGAWSNPSAAIGTKWDTSENRPRNVAFLACIRY